MESNVIRTEELVKIYKSRTVVNKASLEVHQGEIVGLLGPNGAGKTTSFYMIVGLIRPASGHIYLNDENITEFPMYKRAQMGISYLPQEASVFRDMSVEDNILAILQFNYHSHAEQKDKLEELIDEFNLHKVRKNKGKNLSGGERRRTEIARCLASDPKFILLDEPFAGVDPIAVEDIQGIVAKLKNRNIGILITDDPCLCILSAAVHQIDRGESIVFGVSPLRQIYCGVPQMGYPVVFVLFRVRIVIIFPRSLEHLVIVVHRRDGNADARIALQCYRGKIELKICHCFLRSSEYS